MAWSLLKKKFRGLIGSLLGSHLAAHKQHSHEKLKMNNFNIIIEYLKKTKKQKEANSGIDMKICNITEHNI